MTAALDNSVAGGQWPVVSGPSDATAPLDNIRANNARGATGSAVGGATLPFFWSAGDGTRLWGVWRAPHGEAGCRRVWVVCPPLAEEEKSAHRTLVEGCEALRAQGEASLFFALRGSGDSEGDFAAATLQAWREDVRAACREAMQRARAERAVAAENAENKVELGLLGLRLGGSLALQVADEVGASRLVLIEPIVNGRRHLSEMGQRKKLRAMMTGDAVTGDETDAALHGWVSNGNGNGKTVGSGAAASIPSASIPSASPVAAPLQLENGANDAEDLDGWPLGSALRDELNALDLAAPPKCRAAALVVQVGPRAGVAPALAGVAQAIGGSSRAVVMRPFWNLLDHAPAPQLWHQIIEHFGHSGGERGL